MRAALVAAFSLLLSTGAIGFEVTETEAAITVTKGAKTVLIYHKAEVPPPAGQDPLFRRSGFIHPLCAPSGEPVTGIHPADHVHHVGLWGAWVKTVHGEGKPDFWNLKKGTGRVRYKATKQALAAKGAAVITVLQEYVAGPDLVVLEEELGIRVSKRGGAYVVDYRSTQTNVSKTSLELPANRYGGPIAYRGPAQWDKDSSTVLTSEGKTRTDGHATRARWTAFAGPVDGGEAGLAILCHPENHDAPQRVRIWPPKSNNGAVFFNYVPVQEHPWALEPGEPVTLRYQLLVHDGPTDTKFIEAEWKKLEDSFDLE